MYLFGTNIRCQLIHTKKKQYNKLQTINKRIHKILQRVKCGIAKRVKISTNINRLIKSTVFVARPTKRTSVAQGPFKVGSSAEP